MQSKGIVVSVACITYNHAPYIRQCLEGFLMQKTNFPIEIIVHDDASTDGTDDIIREYALKYPELFKVILQEENQYSKGVDVLSLVFERSAGKYIALCEGDDYWTDPLKLQKQVDFLEQNPNYVMCSHQYECYVQATKELTSPKNMSAQMYTIEDFVRGKWPCHPLTMMFRLSSLDMIEYKQNPYMIDAVLFYTLLKKGPGMLLPDVMAVYRIHASGIWSTIDQGRKLELEYNVRLAIYKVDPSEYSAQFLLTQFKKPSSRLWMISQHKLIKEAMKIIKVHYGTRLAFRILFEKFIRNKNYQE